MGHRHLFNRSHMFDMDHDQNPNPLHVEHSYVHLGTPSTRTGAADNSSSILPAETMPIGGINFTSQRRNSDEYSSSSIDTESFNRSSTRRLNEYHSPSIGMDLSHYQATTPGPSCDLILHPETVESSSTNPPNFPDQPSSSHYRFVNNGASGSANPTIGNVRGSCKRKRPFGSEVTERGSTSRHNNSLNTDVSLSSELQLEKPQLWDPMNAASRYRGSCLSIPGEGSHSNVRSRPILDLELNLPRAHVPNITSHHFHSISQNDVVDLDLSVNASSFPSRIVHSTGLDHINTLDLDLNIPRARESNIPSSHHNRSTARPMDNNDIVDFSGVNSTATPHDWDYIPFSPASSERILASDTSDFRRGGNHFLGESSSSSDSMDIGRYIHDLTSSRTPVVSRPYLPSPPMQSLRGRNSYGQRTTPAYRAASSSRPHTGSFHTHEDGIPHSMTEIYPRHLRPLAVTGWRRSDRSERSGFSNQRFLSPPDVVDTQDRILYEGIMFDRSGMYASRNLVDQHRDMRLDIDNMTYEELLDLGERIGTVNTGLSEDSISKCLIEMICCSYDQSRDKEENCAICLEEYMDKEVIGKLIKCGHDYHVECIKKWLSMKNSCPICKGPALKEK